MQKLQAAGQLSLDLQKPNSLTLGVKVIDVLCFEEFEKERKCCAYGVLNYVIFANFFLQLLTRFNYFDESCLKFFSCNFNLL